MALGLRLRVTNTQDRNVIERTFDRFPVRIGRNPLNDFQLDSPFVSQFHAVLELHDGNTLMLRDLGSKNGTMLRNAGKMQAHQLADLGPSNYEFAISSLFFQAFPADVAAGAGAARKKATLFLEGSLPAAAIAMPGTAFPIGPGAPSSPAVVDTIAKLKPFYDGYRAAWGQLYQNLCLHAGTLDAPSRAQLLETLNMQTPAVGFEPDFQRLAQVFKAKLPPSAAGAGAKQDEMLALQAVKELAAQWMPGISLEGPEQISAFLSKLQDAFDVFLKTFIPLRDGYKQFESKMEIKRQTVRASDMHAKVQRTVETAKEPQELARVLLDPADPSNDAPRSIEGIFADLMIHQVAMLDGVMRGVKSLLQELSPQQIEQLAERKKMGGGFFGGKNYEALWKVYIERHSDLADEDKEAFGLIFGPQFVQAYTQLSGSGGGTERQTGGRPAFPAQNSPSGMHSAVPQGTPAPGAPGTSTPPPARVVPPPPRDPHAPNPFEWPPRDPPKRGY
ncbi:MAG: hypothetical protein NVSMB47_12640 [Polyangiales bacterium]